MPFLNYFKKQKRAFLQERLVPLSPHNSNVYQDYSVCISIWFDLLNID